MSFLKASTKEQYLLRLALRLAETYYSHQPISLQQIAKQERISEKYLEELVVPLKKQGLVQSKLGRHGGYVFKSNPRRVSVKDILWSNKNYPKVAICIDHKKLCPLVKQCQAKTVWQQVQTEVEQTLGKLTLYSLIR